MIFNWILAVATPSPTSTSAATDASRTLLTYAPVAGVVVAALVGGIAIGVNLANKRIARKGLAIAQRAEDKAVPRLELECVDGVDDPSLRPDRVLAFLCRVRNPSTSNNSVAQISLRVAYTVGSESSSFLMPAHQGSIGGRELLPLPAALTGGASVQGWVLFVLPDSMTAPWSGLRFSLQSEDVHGNQVIQEAVILRGRT